MSLKDFKLNDYKLQLLSAEDSNLTSYCTGCIFLIKLNHACKIIVKDGRHTFNSIGCSDNKTDSLYIFTKSLKQTLKKL